MKYGIPEPGKFRFGDFFVWWGLATLVDERRWAAYAVLSVLLHGAFFFTLGIMKEAPKTDWFEVSLVSETSLGRTDHRSESGKPQAERHVHEGAKQEDSAPIHTRLSPPVAEQDAQKADPLHPAGNNAGSGEPVSKQEGALTVGGSAGAPTPISTEQDAHKAETIHPAGDNTAGSEQVPKQEGTLTVSGSMGAPALIADGKAKSAIAGQGNDPGLLARSAMGAGVGAGQNIGQGVIATSFGKTDGPRLLHRELPEYPLLARRRKLEGKVLLSVSLNDQGSLMGVEVVEASSQIFIGPSIEAVKRSRFAPATRNGVPVAAKALLPIRFTLSQETIQGIQGDHT